MISEKYKNVKNRLLLNEKKIKRADFESMNMIDYLEEISLMNVVTYPGAYMWLDVWVLLQSI